VNEVRTSPQRPPLPWWRYTRWLCFGWQIAVIAVILAAGVALVVALLSWLFGLSVEILQLFSSPVGVALVVAAAFSAGRASTRW
jgi:hypothetical protein